ncbi:AraC family transcriptional regulator [Pseudoalteromonas sp. MM1]|uniref:GlxA family transcriptional regulator n=1 Tax=Pseudoalteromonas sp. MM1 TaxID=3036714 RepID=UPI002573EC72|nr:helix-turn-helix domain-containing protein [Pseudoalteromonas sp. MM1]BED91263.1 AraC family transcriptional regulator [Pseudoalteromonas sp. MM1]
MKNIAIIAYEDCWAVSVFLAKDFFTIVSLLESHYSLPQSYEVEIITTDGSAITSSSNSLVIADNSLSDKAYDLVIIPPIEGSKLKNMPLGTDLIINWLKPKIHSSTSILSLSTGSYFLAATGQLNKTVIATHWSLVKPFSKLFPDCQFISHKSYLKTGNIYTTGSFEAGISVLLGIVAKDKGDRFSQQCATHLLISDSNKLNLILPQFNNHRDEKINEIQDWINNHSSGLITISELAKQFNFSERNLKRRFSQATGISINKYVQEVRIDKAKKQLLATDKTVNEISVDVGYENSSFFSRLFKKSTGLTPAKWRKND